MCYVEWEITKNGRFLVAYNEGGQPIPGATVGRVRPDGTHLVTFSINNSAREQRTKVARVGKSKPANQVPIGCTLDGNHPRGASSRPADQKVVQLRSEMGLPVGKYDAGR